MLLVLVPNCCIQIYLKAMSYSSQHNCTSEIVYAHKVLVGFGGIKCMINIIRKYCIIISYHHLLQNSHVKQANIYKSPPRIASPAVQGHFPWGEGQGLMTGIHYPLVLRVKLKGFHMPLRHIAKKKSTATGERWGILDPPLQHALNALTSYWWEMGIVLDPPLCA